MAANAADPSGTSDKKMDANAAAPVKAAAAPVKAAAAPYPWWTPEEKMDASAAAPSLTSDEKMVAHAATTSNTATTTATHLLSTSPGLLQQILKTHTTTQTHQVDLRRLVELIDSIFKDAAPASEGIGEYANLIDILSSIENFEGMRQALDDIRSISCEISCNLSVGNVDENTMVLLRRLKNYSWNSKVAVAMAAFAFSIVELSMLYKHRNTDPIAKSVNILKGHPTTIDFRLLESLGIFKELMNVVSNSVGFWEATISKSPEDAPSTKDAMDFFLSATYKILLIVLKIASILIKKQDSAELYRLADEVAGINILLKQKLELFTKDAGSGRIINNTGTQVDQLHIKSDKFDTQIGQSNIKSNKFDKYEKPRPYQYKKEEERVAVPSRKIGISELTDKIKNLIKIHVPENRRNRHVLLLVSDLDISIEEINVLNLLYEKNDQRYEIVWLPVLDLSRDYMKRRFHNLKQLMKWTVLEPSMIEQEVTECIKREWHFIKNPIAVSLTQEGQVTCQNALPMLWIWGNSAFPFTDKTEQELFSGIDEQNGWKLELLLNEIIPDVHSLINDQTKLVCLFGGGDISWIRKFTEKVKYAVRCAGLHLKLVYVGKNKGRRIERKELSGDVEVIESELQWQFWTRLESILYTKIRHGKTLSEQVLQEAKKVVGYGCKGEAWAMFSIGKDAMVTTNGEMALTIMSNYDNWIQAKTGVHFLSGLENYRSVIGRDVHGRIEVHLPDLGDQIPGIMICPECSKVMKIFYTYRCCAE